MAQNNQDEIDLGYLFGKISSLLRSLIRLLFTVVNLVVKYALVIVVLIITGIIIGYFLDKDKENVYLNELIVIPNFESADYLYQEVEALDLKNTSRDSLFFKSILGKDFEDFIEIEIEPIVDIYSFMAINKENIETLKILYDDNDREDFLKDNSISKYYKYHKIDIITKGPNSIEISNRILEYFNKNKHFKYYQEVGLEDTEIQISQNAKMISQIDSVMKAVSETTNNRNAQSVYINSQSELYQMINTKQALLNNRLKLQNKLIDEEEIIKLVSGNYGLKIEGIRSISNKVKVPIYLLMLFFTFFFTLFIYKRLKVISVEN